mmetsp:Transcript_2043/g.4465  ORF Transcript_2043/g.4465 Transcript_2043/m.4465 type:complete len:205 (-) Transcript_2043:1608-2222(-)
MKERTRNTSNHELRKLHSPQIERFLLPLLFFLLAGTAMQSPERALHLLQRGLFLRHRNHLRLGDGLRSRRGRREGDRRGHRGQRPVLVRVLGGLLADRRRHRLPRPGPVRAPLHRALVHGLGVPQEVEGVPVAEHPLVGHHRLGGHGPRRVGDVAGGGAGHVAEAALAHNRRAVAARRPRFVVVVVVRVSGLVVVDDHGRTVED